MRGERTLTPVERIDLARHELALIAELFDALATSNISSDVRIEGTWLEWFGKHIERTGEAIETATSELRRGCA